MKKRISIAITVVIGVLLVGFGGFYFAYVAPGNKVLEEVRSMEIQDMDLSRVADGKYTGEFSYSKSYCQVEVEVANHRIEAIRVLENGRSEHAKKAEGVIARVMDQQTSNVDVVAGATTTSKALLKAIESALSSGLDN